MTTTFTMPTSAEITLIAKDYLDDLTQDDPVFSILPIVQKDAALVMWEQEANTLGLQQIRGLNGAPPKVTPLGLNQYQMQPGIYGEQMAINETDLMLRRQYGTFATPVSIDDLVTDKVRQLTSRQVARIKQVNWTILLGTVSVLGPNGAVLYTDTYAVQTYSAAVAWTTYATSKPLADFSGVALLYAGHSVTFDSGSKAYMNRITFNELRQNSNAVDMYGRRTAGLGTYNSLSQINDLFLGDDLPQIVIYDKGYYNDAGTFTRFIPNGKVIVVGRRDDGAPLGEYQMTRNVSNPGMAPGSYMIIDDNATPGHADPVPRTITVNCGHNGGAALKFPQGVVILTAY